MSAQQLHLREEHDPSKARLRAESCSRVFAMTVSEARSAVAQKRRTPAEAFAVVRRKHDSLRAEYFAQPSAWNRAEATEFDWTHYGPAREFAKLFAEFFPRVEGRS